MGHRVAFSFTLQTEAGAHLREDALDAALRGTASLSQVGNGESEHYVLMLEDGVVLSDALASLAAVDVKVVSCRDERSEIEEAFLLLTESKSG